LALCAAPIAAQEIEAVATDAEIAGVTAAIAVFGCEVGPSPIEKEGDDLFELDDAHCGTGQYDIKLDGAFTIVTMTYDGPLDPAAGGEGLQVQATAEEAAAVAEALEAIECEVGESPVEKEFDGLFEVDDAQCEIGQFDIKLDGEFNITVMTRD
jgi:hypothetical protein